MIIQVRAGGLDDNFSYLAFDDATKDGFAVDPCGKVEILLAAIRDHGVNLRYILNTHGHHDHIEGNAAVASATGARGHMHSADGGNRRDTIALAGGELLPLGAENIEVLHTPGHTPGSVCYRYADALFTGDTLFVDYCGFAADPQALYHSLQTVLRALPDGLVIYPGHDYGATASEELGREKVKNPYLQAQNYADWLVRYRKMT